jgi:hypothetical protein
MDRLPPIERLERESMCHPASSWMRTTDQVSARNHVSLPPSHPPAFYGPGNTERKRLRAVTKSALDREQRKQVRVQVRVPVPVQVQVAISKVAGERLRPFDLPSQPSQQRDDCGLSFSTIVPDEEVEILADGGQADLVSEDGQEEKFPDGRVSRSSKTE